LKLPIAITIIVFLSCGNPPTSIIGIPPVPPPIPYDRWPDWSPVADIIAYEHTPYPDSNFSLNGGIYFIRSDGTDRRHFLQNGHTPAWSPDGTEISFGFSDGGGYAVGRIRPDSSGFEKIVGGFIYIPSPQWSFDGTEIAYDHGEASRVVIYNFMTRRTETFLENADSPSWSPVEDLLVFSHSDNFDTASCIYIINRDKSLMRRITELRKVWPLPEEGVSQDGPKISPDGGMITFVRRDRAYHGIYIIGVDGQGERFITFGSGPDWSPDGRKIVFHRIIDEGGKLFIVDIYTREEWQLTF
jgi:TolB protein